MMQTQAEPELYPIGTAVLSMYIGDKDNGVRRNFAYGYAINSSGEYVESSGTYASDVYVPVSSNYTYQKNGNRMNTYALYDKDKTFMGMGTSYNNTSTQTLNNFPEGVRYIRIQSFNFANQALQLTRIA